MFGRIPSRLTAPFGLLGDEAKLAFRSQAGGIAKLASMRNIPRNDPYWEQYIVLFDTASDVFSLVSPHDIRRTLLEAPENIATLIRFVTARLFTLLSDHTFPTPPPSSVTSYASSFLKSSTGSTERNTTKEVLNCLRILQRVLPVVFEVEGATSLFELEVLWKAEEASEDPGTREAPGSPQFVIADDEGSDNEPEGSNPPASVILKQQDKKKSLPSLGERLFNCLIDLLFCCGFTLPTSIQVDHHKISYVIWEKGVGSTTGPDPNHTYDSNKIEVLRLLLVLFSRQIYVPPSSLFTKPSLYTLYFTQKRSRRDVLTVLCSLLNTAMNSPHHGGTTIGNMTGKLPYNHLVFKGEDLRSTLVGTCLQVLCVLLDFQSGSARDIVVGDGETATSGGPTSHTNAFRYFLMKLHRPQDFGFILAGVVGILEQQIATMHNLLPGARRSIPHVVETVIFFWKAIDLNKRFRAYVLESDQAADILAYLLWYFVEIKDKPQQHGLCRALSHIIQTLSSEPAFGQKLVFPIKVQLPTKWNTGGNLADFMIQSIYAIVATTSGTLSFLYPALIIALSNAAAYFKNISIVASNRLIQLFSSFSNPLFLLADEGHPRLLFFMLEVFNSVIQHDLSGNPNLIYAILTAHKSFEDLGVFTLSRGLREIRRAEIAKEEQARKGENLKIRTLKDDADEPQDEKTRLMGDENAMDVDLERGRDPGSYALQQPHNSGPHNHGSADDGASDFPSVSLEVGIVSPTSSQAPLPMSGKARGKMKERRPTSVETTSSLDRIAATGVGRNGFVPTQEWVTSWQQGLPLDTVMLVISELLPKVQEMQAARHKQNPAASVMDFLGNVSLKHVLPPTPPLAPRKFTWSDASMVWLTSLIWGEIYVRAMTPLGIWNSTNVRLFYVKHTQTQQRQITETVSSVVGGFLGRSNSSDSFASGRHGSPMSPT